MTHNPNSTTHFACNERMEEYGGNVKCCGCIKHECKAYAYTDPRYESDFDRFFKENPIV